MKKNNSNVVKLTFNRNSHLSPSQASMSKHGVLQLLTDASLKLSAIDDLSFDEVMEELHTLNSRQIHEVYESRETIIYALEEIDQFLRLLEGGK